MKRTYANSERERALAKLAANAGKINLTASQLAIPEATVRSWAKGTRSPEAQKMYEPRKRDMAAARPRGGRLARCWMAALIASLGLLFD